MQIARMRGDTGEHRLTAPDAPFSFGRTPPRVTVDGFLSASYKQNAQRSFHRAFHLTVCKSVSLPNRDGGIRTRDPLNPIQVRYRTALRPAAFQSAEVLEPNLPSIRVQPSPRSQALFAQHRSVQRPRVTSAVTPARRFPDAAVQDFVLVPVMLRQIAWAVPRLPAATSSYRGYRRRRAVRRARRATPSIAVPFADATRTRNFAR